MLSFILNTSDDLYQQGDLQPPHKHEMTELMEMKLHKNEDFE